MVVTVGEVVDLNLQLINTTQLTPMSLSTETLFAAALELQAPWQVTHIKFSTAKRLNGPHCGQAEQCVHDRVRKSWRHLGFFQNEAWLHASVPHVAYTACGKTTHTKATTLPCSLRHCRCHYAKRRPLPWHPSNCRCKATGCGSVMVTTSKRPVPKTT